MNKSSTNDITQSNILLTLVIPTYNRATMLDQSLEILRPQLKVAKYPVEFIVSDNASTDNTQEIVQKHIDSGMSVRYIRNQQNIGARDNIIQSYRIGKGKYVWVLGDDDYLTNTSLEYILEILNKRDDYGFIYCSLAQNGSGYEEFSDKKRYLSKISYWLTFISTSIINKKYIDECNFENYKDFVLQALPFSFDALIDAPCSVFVYEKIFDTAGIDGASNGGYNYFKVFLDEYLTIYNNYRKKMRGNWLFYEKEKWRLFRGHVVYFIYRLLFLKTINNFESKKAWIYLLKYYWYLPYFYIAIFLLFVKSKINRKKYILNQ